MPKISWAAADEDEILTASDIDEAEEGFQEYAGDIPTGGVYRFKLARIRFKEASTNNQGLNNLFRLDGSWKSAHAKYNGCPLWDTVWMTKRSAAFAKAFAAALGVSADDLVNGVVVDEDGYVTKIGKKKITEGMVFYIAVKRGEYDDVPRLERSGTGYQVVETDDDEVEDEAPAKPAAKKTAKAAPATKGKKNKGKADDDEPPF